MRMSEVHDVALSKLRSCDQRYTGNRRALVETLATAGAPLTIAGVLEARRELAQSSAYRNLAVLEEAGVVHRIVTSADHARFELTEDVTGAHHHHLVCTDCGLVLDMTLPDELEDQLHHALDAVAALATFSGEHHRIDLLGRCQKCAATQGRSQGSPPPTHL